MKQRSINGQLFSLLSAVGFLAAALFSIIPHYENVFRGDSYTMSATMLYWISLFFMASTVFIASRKACLFAVCLRCLSAVCCILVHIRTFSINWEEAFVFLAYAPFLCMVLVSIIQPGDNEGTWFLPALLLLVRIMIYPAFIMRGDSFLFPDPGNLTLVLPTLLSEAAALLFAGRWLASSYCAGKEPERRSASVRFGAIVAPDKK